MTTKHKHAEVATARSRLGATLQHLVDKKDESQPESEDEGTSSQPDVPVGSASPAVSPRKSSGKSYRKRKRKEDLDFDLAQQQHTYVMKLFDRSVDLAQFDESTPLYPICRAWMKNNPGVKESDVRERSPTPETHSTQDEEGSEKFPDVYTMPPPVKQETSEVYRDQRIPEPLPQTDPSLDIHADPGLATRPEQLLLNHMERWKQIRARWRNQAFINELRYSDSLTLLKEMFDRQCKET